MKQMWIGVSFIAALILVNQIWAEEGSNSKFVAGAAVEESPEKPSSINIDVNFDEDSSDEKSIKKISELVRKIAGDKVADEVIVELDGLSEAEKAELAESLKKGIKFDTEQLPGWLGVVAILAVALIFGSPILILITVFFFMARKRKQKMNVIQVYLDAGKDVPTELLRTFDNSVDSFRSGIMFAGAGLGIMAAFYSANNDSVGALGLIPLFIGVAKLIYWFFEERKYDKL
ncbi:MAG: DUF6249 domain-containing protein [Gammaproteobacteria bacterium]|nr:DUF6249 domain-containing protein [Gammaproteobacteria bacterium]